MNAPGFISRYQILEKIGEGGMGTLFLARDPAIDRLVALKLLRSGFDTPESRERFAREARAAGRLRHPNIVTIFDVGEHEGDPFMAMEFLAGETLHELIQTRARLSLGRRLKLLEELCDGLAYAHRAGIIHRDIKPANLLVDSDGVLKILDFGIVRLEDGGITQSGALVGTINYMSPEQVSGGQIDRRSDIFSVGLVAYELLSSRQAFPGTIRDGLLNRILTAAIEPLGTIMAAVDPEVVAILDRALAPAVEERYPDLTRMRNDLIRARKRIEAAEEAMVDVSGEAGSETMVIARPGVPTPVSGTPADRSFSTSGRSRGPAGGVETAERALDAGDYRTALTIAGRSAAANPEDQTAALILARAQSALLDRGRKMQSSVMQRPPSPSGPAVPSPSVPPPAPVETPALAPRRRGRAGWYGGGAAILVLAAATIGWIAQGTTLSRGGAPPSQPPASAPPAAVTQPPANPVQEPVNAEPPPSQSSLGTDAGAAKDPVTPDRPREAGAAGRVRVAPPASAAPPPASPAPPQIFVVGREGIPAPRRIRYVDPVYPPAAAESRLEGAVEVELTIGRHGRVTDTRVTRSVPGLDQSALTAVRQWEFAPVVVGGTPVPVVHTVTVAFNAPAPPAPAQPSPVKPSRGDAPVHPPAATPPPAEAPKTNKLPDPPAGPRTDEAAIRAVLQQYQTAWESRDADAVARVQRLTSRALDNVRATLKSAEDYRMSMDVQSVILEPDGRHARVRATIARTYNPRAGNPIRVPPTMSTFTLEKRDGRWLITAIK